MQDVVVVGGGIAGLTAGAFAARGGAKTLVLEGAPELGGRARTRRQAGFSFNFGPHALYLGGAALQTLSALGLDPAGAPPPLNAGYFARDGKLYRMPFGLTDIAVTKLMGVADKLGLARAFGDISKGFRGEPGESVAAALERLTASEAVRDVVAAQLRVSTYANAPDIADAGAVFDQLRLGFKGVRYLDSGWAAMIVSLAEAARCAGAAIRTEARVGSVAQEGSTWRIACAGGETIEAAAVVLAVDPHQAIALAPHVATLSAVDKVIPVRAASLDVALSKLPRSTHLFALGLDLPSYFSVHSVTAKGLAPERSALIHASYYLAPDEKPSAMVRARLEALLDLMQPGWRDVLVAEQWLPQAIVTHDLPQAARGGLTGRAPIAAGSGLYLAGDWVGGEGMLSDAAFASGRAAGETASSRLAASRRRVA